MSSRSSSPTGQTTTSPFATQKVEEIKDGKRPEVQVSEQKVDSSKDTPHSVPAAKQVETKVDPKDVAETIQEALSESLLEKFNATTSEPKTPRSDVGKGKFFAEPNDPYGDGAKKAAAERLRKTLEGESSDLRKADASVTFDPSDVFKMPSNSDLKGFKREKIAVDVATPDEIAEIAKEFVAEGVPRDKLSYAMWDIARYCADVGSSEFTTFRGASPDAGGVERITLGAIIRRVCTLRQFCSYFAAVIWNMMVLNNDPPANWQKRGYSESTKFAAFDFFSAVTSSAALQPKNGLAKKVEPEEIIANQTQKEVSLHRVAARQNRNASSYVEVTGGRSGPKPNLRIRDVSDE